MAADINIEDIEIVDIEELDYALGDTDPYSEEGVAKTKAWLKETGTTLYSRPRESFSETEGLRLALKHGNKRLILENLS